MFHRCSPFNNVQCRVWKYYADPCMGGVVKDPRLDLRVECDLDEKQTLMPEYDQAPGLVELWAPVKGYFQDHGVVDCLVEH